MRITKNNVYIWITCDVLETVTLQPRSCGAAVSSVISCWHVSTDSFLLVRRVAPSHVVGLGSGRLHGVGEQWASLVNEMLIFLLDPPKSANKLHLEGNSQALQNAFSNMLSIFSGNDVHIWHQTASFFQSCEFYLEMLLRNTHICNRA